MRQWLKQEEEGLLGIFAGLFGCPLTGKVKVVCYSLILLVFASATPPSLPFSLPPSLSILVAFVLFRWEVAQLLLLIISCSVCWFCPNTLQLLPQLVAAASSVAAAVVVACFMYFVAALLPLMFILSCLHLTNDIFGIVQLATGSNAANLPHQSDSSIRLFSMCSHCLSVSLSVCMSLSLSVCSSAFCELFAFACAISKGNLNYFQSYCSCLQSSAFFFMLALVICPALTSDTCSD